MLFRGLQTIFFLNDLIPGEDNNHRVDSSAYLAGQIDLLAQLYTNEPGVVSTPSEIQDYIYTVLRVREQ